MIYKCTENQRGLILDFLAEDPITNLFVVADIEKYGFDSLDQDIWAYTNELEGIEGVLLRYKDIAIPVHGEEFSGFDTFLPLLQSLDEIKVISGGKIVVDQYIDYFPELEVTETVISVCRELLGQPQSMTLVEELEKADIPAYVIWQNQCFEEPSESEMVLSEMLASKDVIIKIIKNEHNQIISSGRVSAESSQAAMLTRIGTVKTEEGKGYATIITAYLTQHCLENDKKACLFYHNPTAGSIYHRLGYHDTTKNWSMLKAKKEETKKNIFQELIS
ncbi:GNAT family N-acetyltransferase [Carnobacterium funditum]|uniref:GNAT family N-acetyltransferase n=1 Tax=Carnobacterium funditum TaxID=2752 RepID=UPI00068BF5E8|nr:GNAT family N-acetyltransferase [Carnobacterium funditum]